MDFVNTVTWRGDPTRRTDHLVDFAAVVAWAWHADLLSTTERRAVHAAGLSDERAARRVLRRARRLREALHALWTSDSSDTAAVVDEYRAALRNRTLRIAGDRVRWVDQALTVDTPVNRLAIEAVALLDTVALPLVKECGDVACGWLFVDNSHQRSRRWCSSRIELAPALDGTTTTAGPDSSVERRRRHLPAGRYTQATRSRGSLMRLARRRL